MISANELRVGNLLTWEGQYMFVKDIFQEQIFLHNLDESVSNFFSYAEVAPIPLSPEILEACGFVNENAIIGQHSLTLGRFTFSAYEGSNRFSIQEKAPENSLAKGIDNLTIQYLHQLQNMVYFLTGQELTITLPQPA
jgi:hypothetical protein